MPKASICRFNGRGYLINPEGLVMEPLRLPLSHAHLGLNGEAELVDTRPLGERIVEEIGAALSTCIAFGHYRLDRTSRRRPLRRQPSGGA